MSISKRRMTWGIVWAFIVLATFLTMAGAFSPIRAEATERIITVPDGTITRGTPGTSVSLGSASTTPGLECVFNLSSVNEARDSIHDNYLVIQIGAVAHSLLIEQGAGSVETGPFTATTGTTVELWVRLGDDGVSSAGAAVDMDCPPPPETTTTTDAPPPETTTTTTEAPPPETTTTTTTLQICAVSDCNVVDPPETTTTEAPPPETTVTTEAPPPETTMTTVPTPIPRGVPTGLGEPDRGLNWVHVVIVLAIVGVTILGTLAYRARHHGG